MTEEQDKAVEPAAEAASETAAEPAVGAIVVEQSGGITSAVAMAAQGENAMVGAVVADEYGVLAEGAIGVSGQDAIIVASFADMDLAKQAYELLVEAEKADRLHIEGVLVASADRDGKIDIVKMTDHKTRDGFTVGAVAGAVVGIIFPPSIIAGALVAGAGGAALGKIGNLATRNKVAKELAEVLTPGSSGIVALARLAEVEEVKQALPSPTAVKSAPVSDEVATAVKEAAKESGTATEG